MNWQKLEYFKATKRKIVIGGGERRWLGLLL
jgi:hypothetical protein